MRAANHKICELQPVSTICSDNGCSSVIISDSILADANTTNVPNIDVYGYLGQMDTFPVIKCYLQCPYYTGWVNAIRAPIKFCSELVCNISSVLDPNHKTKNFEAVQAVITRSSAAKSSPIHPLILAKLDPIKVDHVQFKNLQQTCASLTKIRKLAKEGSSITMRDGSEYKFVFDDNLLYCHCTKSDSVKQLGKQALVVPAQCKKEILSMSHESPLAGHFGHRKTDLRLREHFFWQSVTEDVRKICRSCDVCLKKMGSKGRVSKVPLEPMPIVTEPFSSVAVNLGALYHHVLHKVIVIFKL